MHQASGTDFVAPYFPLALAVSSESPLQFNFDLRLLDHLRLPCELVGRTEMAMLPSSLKPPARKSGSTPERKQSPTAKNVCARAGYSTQPVSEIRRKDPGCHTLNCRKRGCLNRKAGAWKKRSVTEASPTELVH